VITRIHAIVFSPEAEKVGAFLAEVMGMPSVDAAAGHLIFALPRQSLPFTPLAVGSITSSTLCVAIFRSPSAS